MRIFRYIVSFLCGIGIGIGGSKAIIKKSKEKADKYERLFQLYESWLTLRQRGETLEKYFRKHSIQKTVVYGYGTTGRRLVSELAQSGIKVEYIVDKKKAVKTEGISLYHPDDKLPDANVMVITPLVEGRKIRETLQNKFTGDILLIEDILYECL